MQAIDQLVSGDHASPRLQQHSQDLELGRAQFYRTARQIDPMLFEVDDKVAVSLG
jgi:hypothetical protein